ncbi:MAG: DUF4434 domain-containing protein, partial [Nonomuraea sp.]|nr:DUF4434 domain-containing protein [Nonomuraea sp.]
DAIRRARDPQDGVEVSGYNLDGGTIVVEWSGGSKELVVSQVGWLDDDPLDDFPDRMVTAWVPFDWKQVPAGEWVRIGVKGASGEQATTPLHVRVSV